MTLSCPSLTSRERAKSGSGHSRTRRQKNKVKRLASLVDLTFPDRLQALAEKFYWQALAHPAFEGMSNLEIRRSIENRLWSLASTMPLWWGCGRANKSEATDAQLKALEKARQRKSEIQAEAEAPYDPTREEESL